MFALHPHFDRDQYRPAYSIGMQVKLAGSMAGVRQFLSDLTHITNSDAVDVLDNYTPNNEAMKDVFAFWDDPVPGLE